MADPIGSAIGAFAKKGVKQVNFDPTSKKNLKWLGGNFKGDSAKYDTALDAFGKSNATATSQMKAEGGKANTDFQYLYDSNKNYDPLSTRSSILNENLSALKNIFGYGMGEMTRGDKLALTAMGLSGGPQSSFTNIIRSDRLGKALAPQFGNIMSNLGNEVATIGNQRALNTGNLANLINLRSQTPMLGYGMELDPANALMNTRSGQIGLLGDTVDVARNNSAGFKQTTDTLGKVANSMNGFNDALWQNVGNAANALSSLYGGGGGGGGSM